MSLNWHADMLGLLLIYAFELVLYEKIIDVYIEVCVCVYFPL